MVSVAVLVSGGGTNLQALIDAQNAGRIRNGRIALVISDRPGVCALERARQNGIPAAVVNKKDFADPRDFERALSEELTKSGIDLVVLAGFLTVLSAEFVRVFENRILNVHPSLIPAFCGKGFYGLRVHEAALAHGVKVTGATVHFVNEIPDGGPIVLQKAVAVREDDSPETLQRRVMEEAEWELLPAAVSLFCEGRLRIEGRIVKIRELPKGGFEE